MREMICSLCGFIGNLNEWLCLIKNGEVERAYCPQCTSTTQAVKVQEPWNDADPPAD